jgi:hypothetical protein
MKLLLDENIQKPMKRSLKEHCTVFTLQDLDWLGYHNGMLREKLNQNDFTFLLTADKNLPFQQNLHKTQFTILLIDTPRLAWQFQSLFVPKIQTILDNPPEILPKLIHISDPIFDNQKLIEKLKNQLGEHDLMFI